jgi:hypothetical protein
MLTRLMQISALALALSFTGLAHASDYTEPAMTPAVPAESTPDLSNGSEFLYQTEAHKFDVTPQIGIGSSVTRYSQNNLKRYELSFPFGVQGEWGINQMFSIGLDLNYWAAGRTYKCDNNCPDNTHSGGLMDPTLQFKGRNGIGSGTIRYGADLSVALEKSKIDSSGDSNAASGGTTLAPWIAYEHLLGRGFIGGKIQYDLYKGDRKVQNDTVAGSAKIDPANDAPSAASTDSNGQNLALNVFYEMKFKTKYTAGVNVNYLYHSETRSSVNGASSVPLRDQASSTGLKLYGTVQFTERIALLPAIMAEAVRYSNSNVVDGAVMIGAGAAGRFTF